MKKPRSEEEKARRLQEKVDAAVEFMTKKRRRGGMNKGTAAPPIPQPGGGRSLPPFGLYILDGHQPIPVPDTIVWGHWFQKANRVVAQDTVGAFFVSTVFLGIDHNFSGLGDAILFETMIFPSDSSSEIDCWRCSTWDEALAQHARAVQVARDLRPEA